MIVVFVEVLGTADRGCGIPYPKLKELVIWGLMTALKRVTFCRQRPRRHIAGAVKHALATGPGKTIVTILCDSGAKYQSKLFNDAWLQESGLDKTLPIEAAFG